MNVRRMLVMARKEFLHIVRDPQSLAIVIVMPVILVLLFGYGVNIDLKGLPVVVLDQEGSQQSQDLLKHLQASQYFHVAGVVSQYNALTRALDRGDAKAGVVIPWNFSERLHDGGPVQVQALVDATDDNSANILTGYLQSVVQTYSAQVQADWLQNHGAAIPAAPVAVQVRTWYNENHGEQRVHHPRHSGAGDVGHRSFSDLTDHCAGVGARNDGAAHLYAGECRRDHDGQAYSLFALGMADTVICAVLAIFWFKVPFRGSYATLMISSAMFMVVVLSMGFFISVLAKGQFAASQIALITTFLPAFLLSGFLFAIEQMPVALQVITHIIPARYYVSVLKKIFLKGSAITMLSADLVPLAIFTVVLGVLATRSFHKRLS